MGKLISINISEKKGTAKKSVAEAEVAADWGLTGDAHAGHWHRQISLLAFSDFRDFEVRAQMTLEYGAFGENFLVADLDLSQVKIGDRIHAADVLLEVTQIGKECHKSCEIRKRVGKCIMPTRGVFARVIRGGTVKQGDRVWLESI